MRTIEEHNGQYEVIGLSQSELIEILKPIPKGTFAYFEIHTNVSMNKTGNPYYNQVTKVTKGNVYIGGEYKTRVENSNEDIENFTPEYNRVGEHVEGSRCVLYNAKYERYYLQYEWFEQVIPKSKMYFEGNEIDKQILSDWRRAYTPNKYGVNVQSVKIENIKRIHFDHVHYVVENEVEVEQ